MNLLNQLLNEYSTFKRVMANEIRFIKSLCVVLGFLWANYGFYILLPAIIWCESQGLLMSYLGWFGMAISAFILTPMLAKPLLAKTI